MAYKRLHPIREIGLLRKRMNILLPLDNPYLVVSEYDNILTYVDIVSGFGTQKDYAKKHNVSQSKISKDNKNGQYALFDLLEAYYRYNEIPFESALSVQEFVSQLLNIDNELTLIDIIYDLDMVRIECMVRFPKTYWEPIGRFFYDLYDGKKLQRIQSLKIPRPIFI